MSTQKVNLWVAGAGTAMARRYCKHGRQTATPEDFIWVPISIIEHTSRNAGGHHVVTLPTWFIERENL